MFDVVDLSTNIPWMVIETDNEEESHDIEQKAKLVVESQKILLFCERMKRLSPHWLPLKEHSSSGLETTMRTIRSLFFTSSIPKGKSATSRIPKSQ